MKFTILLSSAILFATALTPISAYADDSNLMCRRSSCDSHGGNGNLSISGFDINVKSSDRGSNRGNDKRNTVAKTKTKTNDNVGNGNDDTVSNAGADHSDTVDTDTVDSGNGNNDAGTDTDNTDAGNVDPGTDNTDNNDAGTDNTDTGASNNPPPQSNSNDIKGFDPFGGLYGPGT